MPNYGRTADWQRACYRRRVAKTAGAGAAADGVRQQLGTKMDAGLVPTDFPPSHFHPAGPKQTVSARRPPDVVRCFSVFV